MPMPAKTYGASERLNTVAPPPSPPRKSMASASADQGRYPPTSSVPVVVFCGFETERSALPRSARPVVPPNVSAIPASGLVAALGTYETNGLIATEDCPTARAIGDNMRNTVTRNRGLRRELDTTPPGVIGVTAGMHRRCHFWHGA